MVLNLDKYKNAKKPNAHSQPQKTDVLETSFRTKRQLFREEKLSFKDYYEGILDLYKFVPKDKHVQELEDTDSDESDSALIRQCFNQYNRRSSKSIKFNTISSAR